jgi:hypothetical protein
VTQAGSALDRPDAPRPRRGPFHQPVGLRRAGPDPQLAYGHSGRVDRQINVRPGDAGRASSWKYASNVRLEGARNGLPVALHLAPAISALLGALSSRATDSSSNDQAAMTVITNGGPFHRRTFAVVRESRVEPSCRELRRDSKRPAEHGLALGRLG